MDRGLFYLFVLMAATYCSVGAATGELPPGPQIDASVQDWLVTSGAPSASVAVVQNGVVTYAHAYGKAQLSPSMAATASTRYAVDSISKEFTAAAVLLLVQDGKLSLDDRVEKWFPDLGDASRVTVRQLLNHTSGIRDFWPQDFVPPEMLRPTTEEAIIAEWARRPLDFESGTQWQYSNTGYVLAAAVVEKISHGTLMAFLQQHIFEPLKMEHVTEDDTHPLPAGDAVPYTRQGLGPARHAPKEGPGWLFGAGALAMTPSELALWDISVMNRSLLAPASYEAMFEPVILKDGTRKDYGLGLDIQKVQGRTRIGHDGAGSGFLSAHRIWPDEKIAIIAVTNNDWATPDDLVNRIAFLVVPPNAAEARARAVFSQFQQGSIDRSLFTDNGNTLLTAQALSDLKGSLGPLGAPVLIDLQRESNRGGMVTRIWKILCRSKRLLAIERGYPNGKFEQFLVEQLND
ncbi:MAG TPA: serine hydrolase domain-containing protein [Steroidobacteraceae bacterium]